MLSGKFVIFPKKNPTFQETRKNSFSFRLIQPAVFDTLHWLDIHESTARCEERPTGLVQAQEGNLEL